MTTTSPLLFQPDPFQLSQMPTLRDGNIPRFLFRIHTPNSYEQTSLSAVVPQAVILNGAKATQDVFTWDRKAAAKLLNTQLRWWPYRDPSDCNLICWTSSLLFVLQYGLHRARQGNQDGYQFSQITLLILDTRSLPDGVFVKDLELIDAFAHHSDPAIRENLAYLRELRQSSRGYYFGEYLSQGRLDINGICSQATMQNLIDSGLFKLMPELESKESWNKWADRVVELRGQFNIHNNVGLSDRPDVRRAITIAETCFPGQWALLVAVMLLALKPRMNKDRIVVGAFAAMYSEKEVQDLSLENIKIDAKRLPEVKQFARLLIDIRDHILGEGINLLLDPFATLSQIIEPMQESPMYKDGLMCQLDPDRCRQIFRSERVMKNHCQASVIHRIGVFVRLEAIRTAKHQTRYQPLQPYMDEQSIVKHARPWQQMVMFSARTQREHAWKSPKYRFTRQQREAWEALVEQAEQSAAGEPDEEEEEEETEVEDRDDGTMADVDEAIDEMETDTAEPTVNAISEPERLSSIQKACLEFCIALMSQSITRKEYDSPLVCALAVLGVKEDGWKGAEQYPPVLLAVIKVARFMVVQQALELSGPLGDEDEFDSDSAYESDDSSNPPRRRRRGKGYLQFVQEMMGRFMVEWVGRDELLYKSLAQFSMAQFRGMVHGLVAESRQLLMDDLLFSSSSTAGAVLRVSWESLRDNPTDERPGWNFLKDHRTRMPIDGEGWLFQRVGQDAAIRNRFMKPGTRSGIHRQEVERGVTVTFIEDGMVAIATRYHKGYNVSGDVKIIYRYLPREVGELVVYYMWPEDSTINVSSGESIFEDRTRSIGKAGKHVHTNMSKATLNMITEPEAASA
ncbi:hypothetical protein E8E12_002369 [Didymella heteroderae]|uniref:Uncharacterized protein n=1 Tax=Didymella heteroderae TaxID=1769908 RepID=A0A9P5BVX9_9PLEO|nr:hypothetical protein E8E12_002369 [Didymella heteroderae]